MEFRAYDGIGKSGEKIKFTLASGPVIIENNKTLLVKHGKDEFWKFPGGTQLSDSTFIENAKREVKEELNLNVELEDNPCVLIFEREKNEVKEYVVLFHYLVKERKGEPKIGKDVKEFKWFNLNKLPDNSAPNIKPVLDYFKK